jgi:cytochrome c-type biogenesis protein CcmH/NrfG
MVVPSWEQLCLEAENSVGTGHPLESIFTEAELKRNSQEIRMLNAEYNQLHHLDKYDIAISVAAGLLGALLMFLLVGIPQKTPDGLKGGTLANYVRDWFDKKFPEEEMEKLANSKVSKVPYDAQDNRNTTQYVDGLSAYYHRLLSLGHDPLLGLIFGVADILTGENDHH